MMTDEDYFGVGKKSCELAQGEVALSGATHYGTCPRQEVPANRGGLFCMSAQTRTDVLPYIFLILVCGYLLPGTSRRALVLPRPKYPYTRVLASDLHPSGILSGIRHSGTVFASGIRAMGKGAGARAIE